MCASFTTHDFSDLNLQRDIEKMSRKLPEKALQLIRSQPRVKIFSLKDLPGSYTIKVCFNDNAFCRFFESV